MKFFSKQAGFLTLGLMASCVMAMPVMAQQDMAQQDTAQLNREESAKAALLRIEDARARAIAEVKRLEAERVAAEKSAAVNLDALQGNAQDNTEERIQDSVQKVTQNAIHKDSNEAVQGEATPSNATADTKVVDGRETVQAPEQEGAMIQDETADDEALKQVSVADTVQVNERNQPVKNGIVFDALPPEQNTVLKAEVVEDNISAVSLPEDGRGEEVILWSDGSKTMPPFPPPRVISEAISEEINDKELIDSVDDSQEKPDQVIDEEVFTWEVSEGANIRQTLSKWSKKHDVAFEWDTQNEFAVLKPFVFEGTFIEAVRVLLNQYENNSLHPIAKVTIHEKTLKKSLYVTDQELL